MTIFTVIWLFFIIDEKIADIFSRGMYDLRPLWFKFSNYDEAIELFKSYGLSSTVTISIG